MALGAMAIAFVLDACYNPFLQVNNGGIDYSTGFWEVEYSIPSFDMVRIERGWFSMGQEDMGIPEHGVTLTYDFYMGKYPVTQEQYEAIMGTNPSHFQGEENLGGEDNLPVEQVSWYDAIVFCNKLSIKSGLDPVYSMVKEDLSGISTNPVEWGPVPPSNDARWNAVAMDMEASGYRLPTEAEWEYACRAGTTTKYYTGDDESGLDMAAWWFDSYSLSTREVGLKMPNEWGLYDMHGNVWEWCWDWHDDYSDEPQIDPTGPDSKYFRILRGGSYSTAIEEIYLAFRMFNGPNYRYRDDPNDGNYGFRLVCR